MSVVQSLEPDQVVGSSIEQPKHPQSTDDLELKPNAEERPKPLDLDNDVANSEAHLSDEDDLVVYTSEDDTISLEDTRSKHSNEDNVDEVEHCINSEALLTQLGLSPPASPSISIAATAGDPEDMELTEEDVDAALAAEMAELKAEIATLRAKAPHIHVESEDEAESDATRKDKDKWEEEEDVLRMAEIKLAYVEENFRKL